MGNDADCKPHCPKLHSHEVQGSTRISGCCDFAHNHRFATVSGEAIPCDGGHVHEVRFTTDSCRGHKHEFYGTTGSAVWLEDGRHVHFLEGCTSSDANHKHEFIASTFIEDPVCEREHER